MEIQYILAVLYFSILTILFSTSVQSGDDILNIGSKRELFVDKYLIERLENVRLERCVPHDEGIAIAFDKPWEGAFCGYCTVIKDGDIYRAYYRGLPDVEAGKEKKRYQQVTCYAESKNGMHWTKPKFGLFEILGTRQNNVVLADAEPATHNFSPFLDTRPGVSDDQRFKGLGGSSKSGLLAFISPDGIHWKPLSKEPVFEKGIFDSQNVAFWSEHEHCYLCYFRTWTGKGYRGFRTVSRTTSKDFINWTDPQPMTFGDTPLEHLYTNQTHPYFRAPQIYVAIAARFMPNRQVLTDAQATAFDVDPGYFKDCSDAVLITSRGGNQYKRTFMEGFIRPGIGLENWVSRTNYPALNVVQTGPAEMSVYVNQNYAQPTAHLRRYSLRLDGFASLSAPYSGGEMLTKPFIFEGSRLYLNFATSAAGEIQVEVQDADGKPVPGFALDDAQPVIGNEIERAVAWKHGEAVDHLSGKAVRLRFVMKDAQLYALRFGK